MIKQLNRMKEISEELLTFSERIKDITKESYVMNGNNLDIIYRDKKMEIVRGQFGAGATVGIHSHEQVEHYLVVCGKANLIIGDSVIVLCTNDSYSIPSGVGHSLEVLNESVILFIRVPPSEDTNVGD